MLILPVSLLTFGRHLQDEVVASALWHVRMLALPQVELLKPRVVWGVLRWVLVNAIVGS